MIDDTLQVKITDNALSRDLFPMDYHCLGTTKTGQFGGWLLKVWLIMSSPVLVTCGPLGDAVGAHDSGPDALRGHRPFEMAAYLKDGYRIAQPINCPDELFAVMACCWALDPEERPKFQQLVQCLTEFHAALGAYV